MTTIAWDGRTLAADRLCTAGYVSFEVTPKIRRAPDGRLLGASGKVDVSCLFMDWLELAPEHRGPRPPQVQIEEAGCVALEIEPCGRIWRHERFGRYEIANAPHAIGSGSEFAVGAMLAGADAHGAVRIAASVNAATGGKVDVLTLKRLPEQPAELPCYTYDWRAWFRRGRGG